MATTRNTEDHPAYLLLAEKREHGYYHLTASVIEHRPDPPADGLRVRNTDTTRGLYVRDMLISSQGSDDDAHKPAGRSLYAWEVCYEPSRVRSDECERMARTFKVLAARMGKEAERSGRPVTFGQYLGRVALALGAAGFVVRRGEQRGWSYDDNDHRFMSLADGIAHADYLVERWVREGQTAEA